jgi:hypothetical protein
LQVFVSEPGDGDNITNLGDRMFHEYTVRWKFPTTTTAVDVHMVIVGPTTARVSTALVRRDVTESCLVVGPGVPAVNPFTPVPSEQKEFCANSKCVCTKTFSGGQLVKVTAEAVGAGTCTVTIDDVFIQVGSGPSEQAQSFDHITHGPGTCTTYPTKPKPTTVCR